MKPSPKTSGALTSPNRPRIFRRLCGAGRLSSSLDGKSNSTKVVIPLSQNELNLRPLEVIVDGDNVERAIKILKRQVAHEGVYKELKRRRFYEKPSVKRKRKQREAERRRRKERRRAMRARNRRNR